MSSDAFAAAAHEVKTPLAMISGFAELLGARQDDETRRVAVAGIQEAAARLAPTIELLLLVLSLGDEEMGVDRAELLRQATSAWGGEVDSSASAATTIRLRNPDPLARYVATRVATVLDGELVAEGSPDLLLLVPDPGAHVSR